MSSNRNKKPKDLGGLHPQELKQEHREFLARSLDRNDVDLSALIRLNRSLHKSREQILESCGELVLLDLGVGRLTLVNDELHVSKGKEEAYTLTPAQMKLCVDFLWRMKLRRKLANRLIRRLNRVAQAMDGADVTPPAPPRYGDLRLHMDPAAVQAQSQRWAREALAKMRILEAKEGKTPLATLSLDTTQEQTGTASPTVPVTDQTRPEQSISSAQETPKEEPIKPELPASNPVNPETSQVTSTENAPITMDDEYAILREYDEAYDKVWDKQTKTWQYLLAEQRVPPDYLSIKAGAAIGAQTRLLSEQEREQEHKRWQAALLARIPHQPTFEELGLKNRVFCLEERRKRCLDEAAEEDDDDANTETKKSRASDEKTLQAKKEHHQEDEKMEDSSDEEMEEKDVQDDEIGDDDKEDTALESATAKTTNSEPQKERKPQDSEEDNGEDKPLEEPKRIRPMSLVAVPSFRDQDLNRIRMVHGELLSSSILESARRLMAEATNEYNAAFRMSNQLFEHRNRLQQNLAYFLAKSRTELAKVNSDHALQVAIAKQRWLKQKHEHDQKRAQQFLPSCWGRPPFGTTSTQNYQRLGGVAAIVGTCVADIVDGSIIMLEGNVPNNKFEEFVPPAAPHTNQQTGESLASQHRRMESEMKRQLHDCNVKFQASEEERQRAWTKMMKTKTEIEPSSAAAAARRARPDVPSFHIPLPPLRNSTQQVVPRELVTRTAVASYTPPVSNGLTNANSSDSKYSAARVRERISADGTVAPVTEPKKTKEGLYVRPAGRTRKGMQWDAVRGIWVCCNRV